MHVSKSKALRILFLASSPPLWLYTYICICYWLLCKFPTRVTFASSNCAIYLPVETRMLESTHLKSDSFVKCQVILLGVALIVSLSFKDKTWGSTCADGTVASYLCPVSCTEGLPLRPEGVTTICFMPLSWIISLISHPPTYYNRFYNDQVLFILL